MMMARVPEESDRELAMPGYHEQISAGAPATGFQPDQ